MNQQTKKTKSTNEKKINKWKKVKIQTINDNN